MPRDAILKHVVRIVEAAEQGGVMMRPSMVAQLMRALAVEDVGAADGLPECLTRREKEICTLFCEG